MAALLPPNDPPVMYLRTYHSVAPFDRPIVWSIETNTRPLCRSIELVLSRSTRLLQAATCPNNGPQRKVSLRTAAPCERALVTSLNILGTLSPLTLA